jgi:hypothetical protein
MQARFLISVILQTCSQCGPITSPTEQRSTGLRGRVGSTPASYSGSHGFKSRSCNRIRCSSVRKRKPGESTVIPRLTKIIRSGITFVSRNVSNFLLPLGLSLTFWLVGLPYVMWSAHLFVAHILTEKISSWNGPTVHVCCFISARASTKTFVSRVRKTAKKIFFSRKIR